MISKYDFKVKGFWCKMWSWVIRFLWTTKGFRNGLTNLPNFPNLTVKGCHFVVVLVFYFIYIIHAGFMQVLHLCFTFLLSQWWSSNLYILSYNNNAICIKMTIRDMWAGLLVRFVYLVLWHSVHFDCNVCWNTDNNGDNNLSSLNVKLYSNT